MASSSDTDSQKHSPDAPGPPARQKWTLTPEAFDKLLTSLGPDSESASRQYLEIRTKLVRFFEWRGCVFPEEHADETFNRMARRVWEGEQVLNPASYSMGVARLLLLEILKERAREQSALNEFKDSYVWQPDEAPDESKVDCLRLCLQELPNDSRELIIEYYQGEKATKIANRKKLSERLKLPINTLRMRALRLREKLQMCLEDCMKRAQV